jgi:hypothetical protein
LCLASTGVNSRGILTVAFDVVKLKGMMREIGKVIGVLEPSARTWTFSGLDDGFRKSGSPSGKESVQCPCFPAYTPTRIEMQPRRERRRDSGEEVL